MKSNILSLIMAFGFMSPLPALAGDASGLDPQAIDQCLADGSDCADAGMEACREYAKEKYTGDDPDFVEKNCLDASHQAWEAKLGETYEALLALESEAGIKPEETLRQAEYSWISFRDDLCHYEKTTADARDQNGDVAELKCKRDEAASHWTRLHTRQEALTE